MAETPSMNSPLHHVPSPSLQVTARSGGIPTFERSQVMFSIRITRWLSSIRAFFGHHQRRHSIGFQTADASLQWAHGRVAVQPSGWRAGLSHPHTQTVEISRQSLPGQKVRIRTSRSVLFRGSLSCPPPWPPKRKDSTTEGTVCTRVM